MEFRLRAVLAFFLLANALVLVYTAHRQVASSLVLWRRFITTSAARRCALGMDLSASRDGPSLRPGDLPGYTGWLRPSSSLAGYFSVVRVEERPARIGSNWTIRVECHHPEGRQSGGSLFYVRAYGPAILPGVVHDYRNGTYDVSVAFFDPGTYQLEIVLTFSKPTPFEKLPVHGPPSYEGFLLPGFPMEIVVPFEKSRELSPPKKVCGMSDLLFTNKRSAIEMGRWLVTKKITELNFTSNKPLRRADAFLGYETGTNSIGFQADYYPLNCSLISRREAEDARILLSLLERTNMPLESKPMIKVLFIGDSTMRLQKDFVDSHYFGGASLRTELINTSGGIIPTMPAIKARLSELRKERANYFVIFNTGLHDINKLCVFKSTNNHLYIDISAPGFSCFTTYATALEEFVDLVMAFPSHLTVYQTTSAGWPKWGVYGAAWPPTMPQELALSPNAVERLNEIAWEILERKGVPTIDSYWLSLARPDNREVDLVNELSKHLVHPGLEVLSVTTRIWATMILETIRDWKDETTV